MDQSATYKAGSAEYFSLQSWLKSESNWGGGETRWWWAGSPRILVLALNSEPFCLSCRGQKLEGNEFEVSLSIIEGFCFKKRKWSSDNELAFTLYDSDCLGSKSLTPVSEGAWRLLETLMVTLEWREENIKYTEDINYTSVPFLHSKGKRPCSVSLWHSSAGIQGPSHGCALKGPGLYNSSQHQGYSLKGHELENNQKRNHLALPR